MTTAKLTAAFGALLLGLTAPAQASYTFDLEHQKLENTIEHLMTVTVDDPECFTDRYAGWISKEGIVVCGVNSPDRADFQDTLRHEGVHLAQRCKAYLAGKPGMVPLKQVFVAQGWRYHTDSVLRYPEHQQDIEAEAWYVAGLNRPRVVAGMIKTHCSFAF